MATHEPSSQMLKTPRFVVNSLNADLQKGRLFRRTIDFANKLQKQHEERGSRGEEETRSNARRSSTPDLPFSPSPILPLSHSPLPPCVIPHMHARAGCRLA